MVRRKLYTLPILSLIISLCVVSPAYAYTFDQNDIIDDAVFNNFNSMSASQIDSFLNNFPNSCISSSSGFQAIEPTGYSPAQGFLYGGYTTAGQVLYDAAQAYNINPQVLIATLEKEQNLVTGRNNFGGYCNNGDQHKYAAAAGYGCPDSGTIYGYSGLNLYRRNGVTISDTGTTCVNTPAKAGFSQQVIRAAWLLKFGQQRSRGNTNWAVIKGSWDNSDDPQSCYGGPTTGGTFAVCPSSPATYHDGYYTIDNTAVHMGSGATAALYWYTPHFSGNQSFYNLYTQWFGGTKSVGLPGCYQATNTTRSCIWYLTSPTGQPYYTSSVPVRQGLADNDDYDYQGRVFFGNAIPLPGNIPIYRASIPGGGSFITADQNEYNSLVAGGWVGGGIDFYADPSWSNSGYPVYRLYNSRTFLHQWTADPQLRQSLLQAGYTDEGIAFTSISVARQEIAPPQGKLLVYRFYIPQSYSHFWTTDVNERDIMIAGGYDYEGVAWDSSSNTSGAPVYRLYAPYIQQHLYTTDISERNTLSASGFWQDEGIAFYVSRTANNNPVYRLYAPSVHAHHLTTDAYERSALLGSGLWRDEGVAWYQP